MTSPPPLPPPVPWRTPLAILASSHPAYDPTHPFSKVWRRCPAAGLVYLGRQVRP